MLGILYLMKVHIPTPGKLHRIVSPNLRQHWGTMSRRNANLRLLLRSFLRHKIFSNTLPCTVTLTRVAPKALDDDNLTSAFKHCRDVIADMLVPGKAFGQADSDPRIKWEYNQRKGEVRQYAIEVEIVKHE